MFGMASSGDSFTWQISRNTKIKLLHFDKHDLSANTIAVLSYFNSALKTSFLVDIIIQGLLDHTLPALDIGFK